MTSQDHLKIEHDGPLARVTLNRPDIHNAFDDALVSTLEKTAAALANDDSVRVILLAGEGKSFCAGADLNWMQRMVDYSKEENIKDSQAMSRMFESWYRLPKPVVGRIHGAALGGGVGLVSICDIAVASTTAVFGFTEARLGILPAVISPFAVAKIGLSAARALFLTGERFDASRAYELGLVQRVCKPDTLDEGVDKTVQDLLAAGPKAQGLVKQLLEHVPGRRPEDVREHTAATIAKARVSEEGQDGIRAFLERRPPRWRTED